MSLKGKRQGGWEGGRKKREERGKAKKKGEERIKSNRDKHNKRGRWREERQTEQRKEGARCQDKRDEHRKEIEKSVRWKNGLIIKVKGEKKKGEWNTGKKKEWLEEVRTDVERWFTMSGKKTVYIPYTYRGQRNSRERTEKEEGGGRNRWTEERGREKMCIRHADIWKDGYDEESGCKVLECKEKIQKIKKMYVKKKSIKTLKSLKSKGKKKKESESEKEKRGGERRERRDSPE